MRKSLLFVLNTAGRKSRLAHRQLSAACPPRSAHLRLSCAGQEQGYPWEVDRPFSSLRGRLKSREEEEEGAGTQFKAEVPWPLWSGRRWGRKCSGQDGEGGRAADTCPLCRLGHLGKGRSAAADRTVHRAPDVPGLAAARSTSTTRLRGEREDCTSFMCIPVCAGMVSTINLERQRVFFGPGLTHTPRPDAQMSYVVLQALDDLDAVVAQVQLSKVHQALQTLHLGQPVALREGGPTAVRTARGVAGDKMAFRGGYLLSRRGLTLALHSQCAGMELAGDRGPDSESAALARMHV